MGLGRCTTHPDASAVAACARCGDYVCAVCRRTYDYRPLCPGCFVERSHGGSASTRAFVALVLGILGAFFLVVPLGVAALFLAQAEQSAIQRGEAPRGGLGVARIAALCGWIAVAELVLLLLLGLGIALIMALAAE